LSSVSELRISSSALVLVTVLAFLKAVEDASDGSADGSQTTDDGTADRFAIDGF
jgi:hypothetical protein